MILLKSVDQIKIMDEANKIVHSTLSKLKQSVVEGISTLELDNIAKEEIIKQGAIPTFLGYNGFPASLCVSINEEIVHGIPSRDRIIKNGDVVSLDLGATYKGMIGDAAITVMVGDVSDKVKQLVQNTFLALAEAKTQMYVGKTLHDISREIEDKAKWYNYGNVKSFCGHGVGWQLHEEPKVLNYVAGPNIHLQEGMVLAIEPMFTLGTGDTKILDDKWTVVTADNSIAAHWEVSIAITENGPLILG